MNVLKTTSLFLFVYFFVSCGHVLARQNTVIDSTEYWRDMILEPKEGQDLTGGYLFFESATKKSLEANDTLNSIYNLSILSIADFELGFLHDSQKDAVHALKLLDEMEMSVWKLEMSVSIHNSLGKTHRALGDSKKALNSYDKVLELTNILNDSVTAYNNKGNVYKDENKDQKALRQYLLGYTVSLRNTDSIENARVLDNLGYIQSKLQNPQGFKKMKEALKIRILKNDYSGLFASYSNFSKYYKQKGQLDSALFYAKELYKLAKDHHGLKYQQEALSILLKLDGSPNTKEYINITDTLTKWKLKQGVKYSHVKYDADKERQKALTQKLQSDEEKKRQRLIFGGLGIILLLLSLFLYFIQKIKYKREKTKEVIRETFQTERRLSKKVHDELANDMSDTLNYIDNHDKIPNDVKDYLLDRLDDLYDRTRDISAEIDGFDSKDFAKSLKFLITQHNTEGFKVITNVTTGINWDKISDHKKINVYRTLQELLVNMRKHSKATEVTVIFKSEGKKHYINYTDNGIGIEIENVHLRGLQNAETRIKNIGGSITFNSSKGNGFKAHLHFFS